MHAVIETEGYPGLVKWSNGKSLECIRAPKNYKSPARPFLVFVVPRGRTPSPLLGILGQERNFDIAARFYDAPIANESLLNEAEFVMTGGLSKFHAASLFFTELELHRAYEGYLFLDGDLEFDPQKLGSFLSLVRAAELDLAQPSVTRDSFCYWRMAYHQPSFVFRETSFVEVMAPYLSRNALAKTHATFTRSISTYGLDLVWPSLLGNRSIGVIDAFQMRHRERVDHISGGFYKYLASIGVDLAEEERRIQAEYGVSPPHAHSQRGYMLAKESRVSGSSETLISVALPGVERYTNNQKLIDLAMGIARLGPSRNESEKYRAVKTFLGNI